MRRGCPTVAVIVATTSAAIGALSAHAVAEPKGTIVYSRNGVLHQRGAANDHGARELGPAFADGAALDALLAAPRGAVLIAGSRGRYRQAALPSAGAALRSVPLLCWSMPRLSADGRTVVCGSGSGATLVAETAARRRWLVRGDGARAGWLPAARAAVVITGDAIVAQASTGSARMLAPHAPTGTLSVSPTGDRAVGIYAAGSGDDEPALHTFLLDGNAARRKLMSHAEPIAWSANGAWLLVQRGRDACLIRTVGGQYKCWDRYQAIAIAPAGDYALLVRPSSDGRFDLFRAELAGAGAARPVQLETDIDGPAAWF
ncbi:MAG TPA: hypothetical protein VML75_23265 [Kofleriaceae bacterium]|nr:hypothetical protein [Kofleriaceae bacterium]